MRIFRHTELTHAGELKAAYAIGNFDGVHLGHQQVIAELVKQARAKQAPAAVLTFFPHPRRLFKPDDPPRTIVPFREKVRLLEKLGVEALAILHFNQALAAMSAPEFVQQILVNMLHASHVVTGGNFIFGAKRTGNSSLLGELSRQHDFGYTAVAPVACDEGITRSSSRIRELLARGDVTAASHLLGHTYALSGRVAHGHGRGRELGFPTLNLTLQPRLMLPKFGVYAARAWLNDAPHPAVVNLGVRPTFGENAPILEAHLLDASPDAYGWHARVELLKHLRPEQKFTDISALQQQIAQDVAQAREFLEVAA